MPKMIEIISKGSVPLRPDEKSENSKIKIFCSLLAPIWKIPMFKIEFLSSNTLSFRVGVLCLHFVYIEVPLRLSPTPTFRALKNMRAVILHFLMHICEYSTTWSINPLNIRLWHSCADIENEQYYELHWYSICLSFSHVTWHHEY